jgi:hypothetical protein
MQALLTKPHPYASNNTASNMQATLNKPHPLAQQTTPTHPTSNKPHPLTQHSTNHTHSPNTQTNHMQATLTKPNNLTGKIDIFILEICSVQILQEQDPIITPPLANHV